MKVSDIVEALAAKYSFNSEEALEFIRTSRRKPKLKVVEDTPQPKLKSILRKSYYCRRSMPKRVSFEYGCGGYGSDDEPLEEYEPPLEILETNEKFPLLLCHE